MKNANFKLITNYRYIGFEGEVNAFFRELDGQGYSYNVTYAVQGENYVAFVTYGK